MSQEIELKLALPKAALAALRRHPLLAGAEKVGNAQTLVNTYYDSPELELRRARVGLRTRKQGQRWLQTVKCASTSAGGLSSRPEWEQPYNGAFDFSAIDDVALTKQLEGLADSLVPVFTTRFRRETYRLAPGEGQEILLMIDSGHIDAGGRSEALNEIELELVAGRPHHLLELACVLAEQVPLMPDDRSKAERGYRLYAGAEDGPARAGKSPVAAGQSPLEAFRALAFDCLAQWQANAMGAAEHDDPEYVHQMRVALRRLRSLIKLFRPALPEAFVERWSEVLRDTAAQMGDARDFDVFIEEILDPVSPAPIMPAALLDGLRAHAMALREQAREQARVYLAHAGMGQRILAFATDLHALSGDALDASADLVAFAGLQMDALRKRSRKRFAAARDLAPEHLHELRVSLKQLRYGVEFFQPLFDARALKRFASALRQAQDQLGYLNDVDIARTRMLDWADHAPDLSPAAHFLIGWHTQQCARVRRRVLLEIEPLLWGKAPWKARKR